MAQNTMPELLKEALTILKQEPAITQHELAQRLGVTAKYLRKQIKNSGVRPSFFDRDRRVYLAAKKCLRNDPSLSRNQLARRLGISKLYMQKILDGIGAKLVVQPEPVWDELDECDKIFTSKVYGEDFQYGCDEDELTGRCGEEYLQICQNLGYRGFRYVGEYWERYIKLWHNKRKYGLSRQANFQVKHNRVGERR